MERNSLINHLLKSFSSIFRKRALPNGGMSGDEFAAKYRGFCEFDLTDSKR